MTSTTLLIGRMPAFTSRCAIHAGDSPIVTRATRPRYRGQRSGASITTEMSLAIAASVLAFGSGTSSGELEVRRELAGHADDAHRVGPVRA